MEKKTAKTSAAIRKLVYSALFLALGLLLPFVTGNIPAIGTMICPMHIPAFLCGFVCGPIWGAAVGVVCPLLRGVLFGMPAFPMSLFMAFELCAYAVCAGVLYRVFPKKAAYLYLTLAVSMVVGRVVYCLVFAASGTFGLGKGVASAGALAVLFGQQFVNTWVGILIHFALIPPIVLALRRAKLMGEG